MSNTVDFHLSMVNIVTKIFRNMVLHHCIIQIFDDHTPAGPPNPKQT